MAEAYLRHYAGGHASVFSAGLEAHGLNPYAVKVLKMAGLDISSHRSKTTDDIKEERFDYILTVCDHAHENCPYFPGQAKRLHQNFPDPAKAMGSEADKMKVFIEVRDLIDKYCQEFVNNYVIKTKHLS